MTDTVQIHDLLTDERTTVPMYVAVERLVRETGCTPEFIERCIREDEVHHSAVEYVLA